MTPQGGPVERPTGVHGPGPSGMLLPTAAKVRVVGVLRAAFNLLALNLALVLGCVPVVTIPVAVNAAMVALDRWGRDGEDRVVKEYLSALRSRPPWPTTVTVGAPMVVAAVATEEVHFFAHGGAALSWVCLGFGLSVLVLSIASGGYVLLLGARYPGRPPSEVWASASSLGLRYVVLTGPLFALEGAAAALLALADPALLLIGLPLAFLALVRSTAGLGLKRAGLAAGS